MKKAPFALAVFLILSLLSLICNFSFVAAEATVSTIISSDTTWTVANSPYNLVGPTRINAGVTLTIEPGVTVNIGINYLQVDGALHAVGTIDNPVRILSTRAIGLGDPVGYINFTDSSVSWNGQTGCILENTIINQTILYVNNPTVKISQDTINFSGDTEHDNVGLIIRAGTSPITNNAIYAAVITEGGSSSIAGNNITGGMGLYGGSPTVSNNQVSGGSTYVYFAKDENRVYNTIAINAYCSPTISNNEIVGTVNAGDYRGFTGIATITGNTISGGISGQGNLVISNNKISKGGISTNGPNVTIQGNQISGSNQAGISIGDGTVVEHNTVSACNIGIQVNAPIPSSSNINSNSSSSPTIKNNNVIGWTQYSVKTLTANDVDAAYNWWGTTDTQAISQSIYDQRYDFNLGKVNISPILTTPDPSAPPPGATQPSTSSSPTSTPAATTSPTNSTSQQNPTATPNGQFNGQTGSSYEWLIIVVPVLVAIIVALIIVIAIMSKHSKRLLPPLPS